MANARRSQVRRHMLDEADTLASFDEAAYLAANVDIALPVNSGEFQSGLQHYLAFGKDEGRPLRANSGGAVLTAAAKLGQLVKSKWERVAAPGGSSTADALAAAKAAKLAPIEPLLRDDLPCDRSPGSPNYLSAELREQFRIVDTDAVSSNHYDGHEPVPIQRYADGLVLDCGAGRRAVYFDNVANFEIAPYDTTDVLGVGEELPFCDASFDPVISIAVLEHVKDPFRCAREIARVLNPRGELICAVPFLQPYHGYPHHYYSVTRQGLGRVNK